MAVSTSVATKIGGGTVAALAGTTGTYFTVKHFTKDSLYAVEKEVITRDVQLTVSVQQENPKKIQVSASSGLENNHTWSCIISAVSGATLQDSEYTNLFKYIQSNLQSSGPITSDQFKKNKTKLVEACAKNRTGDKSNKSITGSLMIEKTGSKFTFKDHSNLDFLLENALYEVEKKVIAGEVGLEVIDASANNSKKVKVFTSSDNTTWADTDDKYYWECLIEAVNTTTLTSTTWQTKLFKDGEKTNLLNNVILVRKCSENRDSTTTHTDKKVKAKLDLTSVTGKSNESELITHVFG